MAVKKGLGRGLDILIPQGDKKKDLSNEKKSDEKTKKSGRSSSRTATRRKNPNEGADTAGNPLIENDSQIINNELLIDINKIEPNRDQPRKQFDEEAIDELSDSIKKYGLIQPLVVQKKDNYYEIIAGERRWRACKKAGLNEVPVIIKEYNESDTLKVSLIENLQRENLNPIEEAQAYQLLKKKYGLKQEEIANSVSKSRTAISNTMRLLKLDERIQNLIMEDQISYGHGRALLSIEDKELQYKTALKIRDDNLSVREAERLVKNLLAKMEEEKDDNQNDNTSDEEAYLIKSFEEKLKEIIGSKVVIKNRKNNKGKIEIDYYSKEEFDRIIDNLQNIRSDH